MRLIRVYFFIFLLPLALFSEIIETFYGPLEVNEPVLLELIESPPMQRLKKVHQYGISYYTTHSEEFYRFEHSVGVFAILRMKGASIEEQIAGLLHDVSHTVFSHVGDYVFQATHQESYQDNIHGWFLEKYGIGKILSKHGYKVEDVLHKTGSFKALETDLPDLCADRIDYNLQGAFHQGFMTKKEIREVLNDLRFDGDKWISTKPKLMKKMSAFALHMTKNCWGSPTNFLTSNWLAKALSHALKESHISSEDIHYGIDDEVWNLLKSSDDPVIQSYFERIHNFDKQFQLVSVSEANLHPKMKFRGIDPWIQKGKTLKRLTEIDKSVARAYNEVKMQMEQGWYIKSLQ